ADPDLDLLLFRRREAEAFEPGRTRRAAAASIDHEVSRDRLLDAIADLDTDALDRGVLVVGEQALHRAIFDRAHVWQRHQAPPHLPLQHRTGSHQSDQIAGRRFDGDAMADPVGVAGDIAARTAGGDDLVGPARKEVFDHVTAAR